MVDASANEAATCRGEQIVSLWLESGGAEVRWNYSKAPTALPALLGSELPFRSERDMASFESFRRLSVRSAGSGLGAGSVGSTSFLGEGRVALVAKSGLMLILSNSPSGKLQAGS